MLVICLIRNAVKNNSNAQRLLIQVYEDIQNKHYPLNETLLNDVELACYFSPTSSQQMSLSNIFKPK